MNNNRHILVLLGFVVCSLIGVSSAYGQDYAFSESYTSPILSNPAFAGTAQCNDRYWAGRLSLNYRNQAPAFVSTSISGSVSYDQHFNRLGGGLGFIATKDKAIEGIWTTNGVRAIYSYRITVKRKLSMRFGVEAEIKQKTFDISKKRFYDQIDLSYDFVSSPMFGFESKKVTIPNLAGGWLIYSDRFYGGIAVHNVLEPNQPFVPNVDSKIPRKYTVHAAYELEITRTDKKNLIIIPTILLQDQAQFTNIHMGTFVNKGHIVTGFWYKKNIVGGVSSNNYAALIGYKSDRIQFGYSYEVSGKPLGTRHMGIHQISTAFNWCNIKRQIERRPTITPFF